MPGGSLANLGKMNSAEKHYGEPKNDSVIDTGIDYTYGGDNKVPLEQSIGEFNQHDD